MNDGARTVLCLTSYDKGYEFIRACKRQGARVLLLTVTSLEHAPWPRESIDAFYHMPDLANLDDVILGVSHLARQERIDRVAPLDDYDVEPAAALREHLRLPGMGTTITRYFRDKLAMRMRARERGILVPDFVPAVHDASVGRFVAHVPAPWVLKPRSEASSIGIVKVDAADHVWPALDALSDRRSFHLLERYIAGDVYHADSIVRGGEAVFAEVHRYGRPPMDVFHHGGVSMTRTVRRGSPDEQTLRALNREVIAALGMERGVAHLEFIKGREDGRFYFLEAAARVGGAYIVELIEAATGINLWAEWAGLEAVPDDRPYHLPAHRADYGAIVVSLARQEQPDTSAYTDPEIVWRLVKRHHAGFCLSSPNPERIDALLAEYSRRFHDDFMATLPPYTGRPPSED